jgi:hypothetical protein
MLSFTESQTEIIRSNSRSMNAKLFDILLQMCIDIKMFEIHN